MNEPLTDSILVKRASSGDNIAFSELVNRHYVRVLRVAFGLVKNRQDAEDIVQDAFARVYTRLPAFTGASSFYTWLYRIVVNRCIDTLRRRRRQQRVTVDDEAARAALREGNELFPRLHDEHPAVAVQRRELCEQLQSAFADLPEIHQAVLLLRELEGLSYEEISQTLDIKKGTVMSRLFHARRAIQDKLGALHRGKGKRAAPEGNA